MRVGGKALAHAGKGPPRSNSFAWVTIPGSSLEREEIQPNRRKPLIIGGASAIILLLDQLTKYLATAYLSTKGSITLIAGLLNFTYVRNKGAAFGLLAGTSASFRIPFFLGITALAFFLLWRFYGRIPPKGWRLTVAVSLVFSGALGNLVDRAAKGEVVDFIDLHWGVYHWPAFNLADTAITIGAALLVWHYLRTPGQRPA